MCHGSSTANPGLKTLKQRLSEVRNNLTMNKKGRLAQVMQVKTNTIRAKKSISR